MPTVTVTPAISLPGVGSATVPVIVGVVSSVVNAAGLPFETGTELPGNCIVSVGDCVSWLEKS